MLIPKRNPSIIARTINYMSANPIWTPIKFTAASSIPNCSCPCSSPHHEYAKNRLLYLSLALQSAFWRVAQLLGFCKVPLLLHLSKGVGWHQYLNCKILHGGTYLQPWPNVFGMQKYFRGNYVFPSPNSSEDQKKKVFSKNWGVFGSEIK